MRDLVEMVVCFTRFGGELRWDASKPDGQPRRALDASRALERAGVTAPCPSSDGLRATIGQNKGARSAWPAIRACSDMSRGAPIPRTWVGRGALGNRPDRMEYLTP
jgi:hypothetical protein